VRPDRLVLVAGTGTEVGKTWVATLVARQLRDRGHGVAARKAVQSFEPGTGPTDADRLASATGEQADAVCPAPRWLPVPMAPPIAAAILGRPPFTVADLVGELRWPPAVDVGLVEAAGGVRSPLADDGDTVDLAAAIAPDLIVLVTDGGLGVINAVRSALAPLDRWPVVVLLNRFDPADPVQDHNRRWLADRDGLDVAVDVGAVTDRILTLVPVEST
jgi:dethiobiotin synthetase